MLEHPGVRGDDRVTRGAPVQVIDPTRIEHVFDNTHAAQLRQDPKPLIHKGKLANCFVTGSCDRELVGTGRRDGNRRLVDGVRRLGIGLRVATTVAEQHPAATGAAL